MMKSCKELGEQAIKLLEEGRELHGKTPHEALAWYAAWQSAEADHEGNSIRDTAQMYYNGISFTGFKEDPIEKIIGELIGLRSADQVEEESVEELLEALDQFYPKVV